jgi:hypothetical protein
MQSINITDRFDLPHHLFDKQKKKRIKDSSAVGITSTNGTAPSVPHPNCLTYWLQRVVAFLVVNHGTGYT